MTRKHDTTILLGVLAALTTVIVLAVTSAAPATPQRAQPTVTTWPGVDQLRQARHHLARSRRAARRYRAQRDDLQVRLTRRVRENRALRHALVARSDVVTNLRIAAVAYHVDAGTLIRKARCESNLNPDAKNRYSTASGVGQFLDSTWASTPFAQFSVFDPVANPMAMAWMHATGRGNEWVCR